MFSSISRQSGSQASKKWRNFVLTVSDLLELLEEEWTKPLHLWLNQVFVVQD